MIKSDNIIVCNNPMCGDSVLKLLKFHIDVRIILFLYIFQHFSADYHRIYNYRIGNVYLLLTWYSIYI